MQEPVQIIGNGEALSVLFATIGKVAATDANVLILGENGTGKELVAKAIHQQSKRASKAFVGVDMGVISQNLFESELFGHVKGAFTDAREDRAGRFELAEKGSLFLDEIGNLPTRLQAKLLSVLQQRSFVRVGSNRPIAVDIRLICATNMPLYEMIGQKTFRQDLLYRINTVEIKLPPLRNRKEDIPLLVAYFIDMYARKYDKRIQGISPSALQKMEKYEWPGNIRELQNTIERAVIMTDEAQLGTQDFVFQNTPTSETQLILDQFNLEEVEKRVIRLVMHKHDGNVSRAAKELGLTRTSLYRRIEKYEL